MLWSSSLLLYRARRCRQSEFPYVLCTRVLCSRAVAVTFNHIAYARDSGRQLEQPLLRGGEKLAAI